MPGEGGRYINVADFYKRWGFYPIAGGDGDGDGSGDGNGAGGEVQQQLADAQKALGAAQAETKSLKDAKGDLERKLDDADKELLGEDYLNFKEGKGKGKGAGDEGKGGEGSADDKNFDINNATNAELATFIGKQGKGDLDVAVKELSSRMTKADERVGLALAQVDISLTAMRHPDGGKEPGFSENFNTIKGIAKANPTWPAEKCYQQFKMEKAHTDKEKSDADEKKAEEERRGATEKGEGMAGSATAGKQLTKEEAASLAYKQAFGNRQTEE
jgi:hypothetical protein